MGIGENANVRPAEAGTPNPKLRWARGPVRNVRAAVSRYARAARVNYSKVDTWQIIFRVAQAMLAKYGFFDEWQRQHYVSSEVLNETGQAAGNQVNDSVQCQDPSAEGNRKDWIVDRCNFAQERECEASITGYDDG